MFVSLIGALVNRLLASGEANILFLAFIVFRISRNSSVEFFLQKDVIIYFSVLEMWWAG